MEQLYDVFISYSRQDYLDDNQKVIPDNVVLQVKKALTESNISYWIDEEGIYSGQNFAEKIVTNIEASKVFLFLSSVNSNESKWTCKEIATADEFGKHIIPVRIDSTPYNSKVLFRISDLDYIEFYSNPEKGLQDIVHSIKTHLAKLEQEQRDQEERIRAEQIQLVNTLRVECESLTNKSKKLEWDRKDLILKIQQVTDEKQKQELLSLIEEDCSLLLKEIDDLKQENKQLKDKLEHYPEEHSNPISICFQKYAVFSGRASRTEFWWWFLFFIVINFTFIIFITLLDSQNDKAVGGSYILLNLALLIPTLSVATRRCHDTNHKGWWLLVPIYNIVLMCMPSRPESNVSPLPILRNNL